MSETKMKLPFEGFEIAYATLAEAIDSAGEKNETLFLAKLALLLAHEQGDLEAFNRSIVAALEDLDD